MKIIYNNKNNNKTNNYTIIFNNSLAKAVSKINQNL